jgi:hypothetical protein
MANPTPDAGNRQIRHSSTFAFSVPPPIVFAATCEADLSDLKRLRNDGRVMAWVGFLEGLGYDDANIKAWFDHLQLSVFLRLVYDYK